jgi:hypothetical protein
MSNYIVKQLRAVAVAHESGLKGSIVLTSLADAADEIERLRLIIHRWNSCDQVSGELCGWDSEKTLCQFCKVTDHE